MTQLAMSEQKVVEGAENVTEIFLDQFHEEAIGANRQFVCNSWMFSGRE